MTELLKIKLPKEQVDRMEIACIKAGYGPKNARRGAVVKNSAYPG